MDKKDFQNLFNEVDMAMRSAKQYALNQVDIELEGAISDRRYEAEQTRRLSTLGDVEALLEFRNK